MFFLHSDINRYLYNFDLIEKLYTDECNSSYKVLLQDNISQIVLYVTARYTTNSKYSKFLVSLSLLLESLTSGKLLKIKPIFEKKKKRYKTLSRVVITFKINTSTF